MTIKRFAISAFVALLAILLTFSKAQTTHFSADYDEFVNQLEAIIAQTLDKKKNKAFIDELDLFLKSDADSKFKNHLIICCNAELKRKAKPYPNYYNTVKTFIELSKTDKLTSENYNVWWTLLEGKMQKKNTRLSTISDALSMISDYIADYTICNAPSVRWRVTTGKCKFRNVNSQLVLDIPETTIIGYAQQDSV